MTRQKWTLEEARVNAVKGGKALKQVRRLERLKPEEALQRQLGKERVRLVRTLLDAAYGRGSFGKTVRCECGRDVEVPGLPAVSRLSALQTALAYSVGRPKAGVPLLEAPRISARTADEEGFTIE